MGNMHKSKEIVWLVICFLFLSSFFVFCSDGPCKASGNTIYVDGTVIYSGSGTVDDPFKTIQAAIDAAEDGDTIKVLPGTYGGDIAIDKSITLMSGDATGTIMTGGSDSRYFIDITADSVSLEGFKIRDMTETSHRKAVIHIASGTSDVVIINNRINHSANGRGIYLDNTYKAIIKNNIINDTFGSCIYIENSNSNGVGSHTIYGNYIGNCTRNPALQIMSSSQNHIENNTFRNSTNGIYIVDSSDNHMKSNKLYRNSNSGIVLEGGSGNIVENSTIYNNVNLGIDMDSSLGQIIKNNIYSNGIGISLGSSGDIVRNNSIHRSKMYGIYAGTDSNDNTIFKNTFHINLGISHAKDDGNNQWDDGVNGNYWDDFKGPDPTSSSNTYTYSERPEEYYYTRGGVLDRHPTGSYQKPPQITNPNPGQLATGVSKQPTLSVKVTDPDNGIMDVYFYYILDDVSHLIQIDTNVESGATAAVPFFSTESDNKGYTYKGFGYRYNLCCRFL